MNLISKLDISEFLSIAQNALVDASRILDEFFFGGAAAMKPRTKSDASLVTAADLASERLIQQRLSPYLEFCTMYFEERGYVQGRTKRYQILVDPLDGTSNFSRVRSEYALCIALADMESENQDVIVSIAYEPLSGRMWSACRGGGCSMQVIGKSQSHAVYVSTLEARKGDVCLDASITPRKTFASVASKAAIIARVMPLFKGFRMLGSNVLAHALVANGSFEAAITDTVGGPFDIAGYLLVEEAGGKASNLYGEPVNVFNDQVIVTSNGIDHEQLISLLREAYSEVAPRP
jgi:myo-inositol-1(or 4)-monophosphatase